MAGIDEPLSDQMGAAAVPESLPRHTVYDPRHCRKTKFKVQKLKLWNPPKADDFLNFAFYPLIFTFPF
jgi:hypothetical protein